MPPFASANVRICKKNEGPSAMIRWPRNNRKTATMMRSPRSRMRPVRPVRRALRRRLTASPIVPIPLPREKGGGARAPPPVFAPSRGSLADAELLHERPVAALVLVERHGGGRRVAVAVEAVRACRELEVLRVLD